MESSDQDFLLERVLLVDDDDTTNYINQRVLVKASLAEKIDVVKNGEEALRYLRTPAQEDGNHKFMAPDIMFVDIKMSVMDGFEFLDEYRHLNPEMKAAKVFMLSSSASFYDLQRLKDYPEVLQHISKPLTVAHLLEIRKQYFGNNGDSNANQPLG